MVECPAPGCTVETRGLPSWCVWLFVVLRVALVKVRSPLGLYNIGLGYMLFIGYIIGHVIPSTSLYESSIVSVGRSHFILWWYGGSADHHAKFTAIVADRCCVWWSSYGGSHCTAAVLMSTFQGFCIEGFVKDRLA